MKDLYNDKITIQKSNGDLVENIPASVQQNKIFMDADGILVDVGDVVIRRTSVGHEQRYEVIDPGFHEKFYGIDAHYQMSVAEVGRSQKPTRAAATHVTYNIHGANSRVTNGNDYSENRLQQNFSDLSTHITELRDAVKRDSSLSSAELKDALELVEDINEYCESKKPKASILKAMISNLPSAVAATSAVVKLLSLCE